VAVTGLWMEKHPDDLAWLLLRLVREERDQIAGKHWLLYDPRESTAQREKEKKDCGGIPDYS